MAAGIIFRKLQDWVWIRHIGATLRDTNMAAVVIGQKGKAGYAISIPNFASEFLK